ncbi:MAG: histidine--tRNA ligase [Candidatus Aenigmarchaeota archaeon]|nr:histidine--tRNA ligase [Candidatus Aenigmarchaeota archaeon]
MKFQTPKGTRDLMPEDAARMNYVRSVVSRVFESFGFAPLYTPAFESFELLGAKGGLGEAVKDEIYYFKDKSDRELGLRFDQTMPLARVISSNPQMPKPFKRYAVGTVWRYDNPQAMRWREFWQADADIVGSSSIVADAEVIAAACTCLEKLGFKDYSIRVNNRKFLDAKIGKSVDKEKLPQIFRILDKLDKIGEEGVRAELRKIGCDKKEVLAIISDKSCADADEDIVRLRKYLKPFGFDKRLQVDASLVRGLEYYTGLVFEVSLGKNVSCGGGGRYDDLIGKMGGQATASVGISLGLDRVAEVMKEERMAYPKREVVFVVNVDEASRLAAIKLGQELRAAGIDCATNVTDRPMAKQFDSAESMGARYVVIVGKDEIKSKKFKLRDMETKKQSEKTLQQIVKAVE